ncbi:hypothetical protein [Streptomyces longisporus]|uniref:Lon N-terminal domain-containing protein n=1 Tax=Streptomyces longisporus TaxID=1948 RepID=A0ABN3NIV8_STRLO
MEPIPYALTGYLDHPAVPGTGDGTAAWRLTSSPADCMEEQEALIPCTTSQPDLVHRITHCQTGDLLRVTGHLHLPDTADGLIRLDVDTLEVLWEVEPEFDQLEDEAEEDESEDNGFAQTEGQAGQVRAVQTLGEALAGLAGDPSHDGQPGIQIVIWPIGIRDPDNRHSRFAEITTATTHHLADAVDAMRATLNSQPPQAGAGLDPQALADLTDYFDDLDLTELTRDVLDATRPEDRLAVTRALDDLFGDIPVTGIDDNEQ